MAGFALCFITGSERRQGCPSSPLVQIIIRSADWRWSMYMEPYTAWGVPGDVQLANWSDFQLANRTMLEPAAVWAPVATTDQIFDGCIKTSSATTSSTGGQLVEYAAATQNNDPIEEGARAQDLEIKIHIDPIHVFDTAARRYKAGVDMKKMKMHRYPASIRSPGDLFHTVPTTVAIGPYYHGQDHLRAVEEVKHVAAYHCIRESGRSVQEMYDAVASVAGDARILYDRDVVDGIADGDFLPMMFYDACFLVQYMLTCTANGLDQMDPTLRSFYDANDNDIYHDIMQLENQLPWRVVETVMRFRPVPLTEFVASLRGCLQDRKVPDETPLVLDDGYEPPHLLGLLRYYIVGRSDAKLPSLPATEAISFSVSAIELAEIGITLTANKTTELIHMGVGRKGNLFAELALAPLSLDHTRACLLLNMAALELCTTSSFQDAEDEASAVCSYLLLLAMLVAREEDVHELRKRRLLQGGGGLTNKEALEFLTSTSRQNLRLGSRYIRTMEEIEHYRVSRRTRTKVHAFVYRNFKAIIAVISATAALVGIIGTLKSLKAR
ncbi:hypothetical protein BS78_K298100 [Paspalum vaginatum]|uniref:Uncharacterized protein n=1 Tax=Paspalum vaginatum TaxID=158149 RepID=A0A9W7XAJ4_9POAL|nr:hypothetical protein BS78_K298100 [Paspalum vaginatum]